MMKTYLKKSVVWMMLSLIGIIFAGNSERAEIKYAESQANNLILTKAEYPVSYEIENFPILYQMPELPTGCEITALTMLLNYYGLPAEKVEMATEYLPTLLSAETYVGEDGRLC